MTYGKFLRNCFFKLPMCSVLSIPVLPHLACHYSCFCGDHPKWCEGIRDAFNLDFASGLIVKIFLCSCLWWEGYSDILPVFKLGRLSSCLAHKIKCGVWSCQLCFCHRSHQCDLVTRPPVLAFSPEFIFKIKFDVQMLSNAFGLTFSPLVNCAVTIRPEIFFP